MRIKHFIYRLKTERNKHKRWASLWQVVRIAWIKSGHDTPQHRLKDLLKHIVEGKFGTKHRAELIGRINQIIDQL